MSFFVSTAIPYVNAAPHLGHALELVQADVLARQRRARGEKVRFLTGTDDNALKNVTAARRAGVPVGAFVAANGDRFAALKEPLGLSFDDFVRTSEERHRVKVAELWQRSAGDFYRRSYTGSYCLGCEQFKDSCDEHDAPLETVREENWFFRLSRYEQRILALLEDGTVTVEPAARRNEVLAFVRAGLEDISVSRPAARAGGWGIPVPGDPGQVIYVWWDALANYLTADPAAWAGAGERVHVVGKGIVRFHAVHWLALLLAAGEPLPTTILVHDYLTVSGAKLAKSAGNAVDPVELAATYGTDAVRWWLLRDVAPLGDTDFTVDRLIHRHDSDLAHGVGNLVHRTVTLAHRYGARSAFDQRHEQIGHDFRALCLAVLDGVARGNQLVEAERPWQLDEPRRTEVITELLRQCHSIVEQLTPLLPGAAERLRAQITFQDPPSPVFAKLRP
ncbi:methionine--tRNA ligase [Symbioplanes lichenis]|uniref:methionine--tRNA ligase n=1 Tax=Symbioplanes lichenis TaxID=1629072 RepID=UPI0027389567|nr:methionine--tRNA ligase [Actinoplanes lichenis]